MSIFVGGLFEYRKQKSVSASPPAGPITFTDGYGGDVDTAQDNILNGTNATTKLLNLGTHENFEYAPTQNGIFRFNLSSIPAGSTCLSATLYLYKSYPLGEGGGNPVVRVYSIAEANAAWQPGLGSLDLAASGESCWNSLAANGTSGTTTAWAGGANGCGVSGTDYEATELGNITITSPQLDEIGTEYQIELNTTRISGWFGNPNTNYGILIKTAAGGDHFGSANNATPAYRPKLVVTYS